MECFCGRKGLKVKKITVGNHVNPEYWHLLDEEFYFCPNPDCEVVYFNGKVRLTINEVKTKVFFKEKGSPRPLCYCKQVTEEDVINAIMKGARSVEEVEELTGIGNGGHCVVTNPSGRCCRQFYVEYILTVLGSTEGGNSDTEVLEPKLDNCCKR